MTQRLYYEDAYIQEFSAKIVRNETDYVVLSETAFYPTGGGQPHDVGHLNGVAVTNVEIIEGEIRHYLASPITETEVEATIDWERRFDHMQQHTGQHILSAAFDALFHFKTVSFHLGKENVTIDLNTDQITQEQLEEAEKLANKIILENRPIETKWITEAELSNYPLRKPPKVKEDIRLVIIPEYDYNACGGIHPSSTGQVGQLKIVGTERQKKQIRVEFLCGNRILSQFARKEQILKGLISTLSSPENQLLETTQNLITGQSQLEKQLAEAQEKLLSYEAKELREHLKEKNITSIYQDRPIQQLQKLAKLIVEQDPHAFCMFVGENNNKLQIILARGTARKEKMKDLIHSLLTVINGKGGGNDSFAQGGGDPIVPAEKLVQQALSLLST